MAQFFGSLSSLVLIYIAASMIIVGKAPPRAIGLLGLIVLTPSALYAVGQAPGFVAGFIRVLLTIAVTGLFIRLLLGKRLFAVLVKTPLNNLAKAWFNRKGRKSIKDIWGVKGGK